jgi:hypothetical protein
MQPESGMSMQAEGGNLHATRKGATVAPPLFTSGSQISRSLAPRSSRSRSRRSEALASGIADSTCEERRGRRAEHLHAEIRGARFGDCVEHQGCEETSVPTCAVRSGVIVPVIGPGPSRTLGRLCPNVEDDALDL